MKSHLREKMIPGHCLWRSDGWRFVKEIADLLDDKIVNNVRILLKSSFGIYSDIVDSIESYLYEVWDDDIEIEICGVCTDICVISNAMVLRSAFPNAPITVDASCCAGSSKEMHDAALKVMKGCLIDVVNEHD